MYAQALKLNNGLKNLKSVRLDIRPLSYEHIYKKKIKVLINQTIWLKKYKFNLFLLQKNGFRGLYEYYFSNFILCGLKLKYTVTQPLH
jgi:hypothetical protein